MIDGDNTASMVTTVVRISKMITLMVAVLKMVIINDDFDGDDSVVLMVTVPKIVL